MTDELEQPVAVRFESEAEVESHSHGAPRTIAHARAAVVKAARVFKSLGDEERLTILAPDHRIDSEAVRDAIEATEPREHATETLADAGKEVGLIMVLI